VDLRVTTSFRVGVSAFALAYIIAGISPAFAARKQPAPAATATPTTQPTAEPASIAIPRLEAKIKSNPNDSEAMTQLAGYYLDDGRPDLALPLTHRTIELGTKSAQVYYFDGIAHEQLGHLQEAGASLEHATDLDPTNGQVLFTLTDLYLRTNHTQDAEHVAKRATTFNANDKRAFLNYSLVLLQEHRFDDARTQLAIASKLDPKDAAPIILEARSYEGQNAADLALQTFDRALSIDPKSFDALIGKARVLAAKHEMQNAIAVYESALPAAQNDDERVAVLDQEAGVYMNAKLPADAENVIKRSISAYPKVSAAHMAYGDFYAAQKKFGSAEVEWKLALGPNNDNREAMFRLGDYYVQSNQAQKAVDVYKRAVAINPADPQALAQLGQAYGLNRQFSQARDAYRHSFAIVRTPQALAGIAASDYQIKSYREGAAAFDALNEGATDFLKANPQLYYVMGKLYAGNSEKAKAKTAYKHFLAYVKPGTPVHAEVKKLLADLDAAAAPKPKSTGKARS
jgi:tetratricopeptide (TPR) repeat protein